MIKKTFLIFLFCLISVPADTFAGEYAISERYKWAHNLMTSLALTTYFTITDSNQQSQDVKEWELDLVTAFNIMWRTVLFGVINYYQSSYIPDNRGKISEAEISRLQNKMALAATTAALLTYNSRYEKVLIDRFYEVKKSLTDSVSDTAASFLSALNILVRNFAWFYTFPLLLKPVNSYYYQKLPRQQTFSKLVHAGTKSAILAHAAFSLIDLLYQHGLVSIKHTLWQFLPVPSNAAPLRFDDCTSCYLGTNLFGKSGPIARGIKSLSSNTSAYSNTTVHTDL